MLLHSYDYKEIEVTKGVKNDLRNNLENYYRLNQYISAKAKIAHLSNDYGQLDVLLALQEPQRKIYSYNSDEEKREISKTNYIVKKRKIFYPENLETILENQFDVVLISDESYNDNPEKIVSKFDTIILIYCLHYKVKLIASGFKIISEEKEITVLKKN